MKRSHYYVVLSQSGKRRLVTRFQPRRGPELPGDIAEVGPFETRRGAEYFRDRRGPNCVCVADAEELAGRWQKVPSVTHGGKPHFWIGEFPGLRLGVVWDRASRGWRMRYGADLALSSGELFDSDTEAKAFADQFAYNYPNP